MDDEKEVPTRQGAEYAKKVECSFFEVSAKENISIMEMFQEIGSKLKNREDQNKAMGVQRDRNRSVLEKPNKLKGKKKGCCQ